jgi:drug/metabolite transporter (DMT)-like permease
MAFVGLTTTLVGSAILSTAGPEQGWDRLSGVVYVAIAAFCFVTCSVTRTRHHRLAELMMLGTASRRPGSTPCCRASSGSRSACCALTPG